MANPVDSNYRIWIIDLDTSERLELQFVPVELDYQPNSNFVAITSPARNNHLYHYTGGEDTLSFTIDWHCIEQDRLDVIKKCKWLESLSKNDGYGKPPHRVMLSWGDNKMMGDDNTWLVVAAPYRLSLPDRQFGMLPRQAYQDVTLKRITPLNRTRDSIRGINTYYNRPANG